MTELEKAILKTIIYFNIFDYPLTPVEIWKFLYSETGHSLGEINNTLETSNELKKQLEASQGFYFLAGRGEIVRTRLDRYNIASGKFRRALRAIKICRVIPFLRLVAVCNNLGFSNARQESDIDLFVVARKGKIWFVRFWLTLILRLMGFWRHGKKIANRLCLSFFITDDNLDLSPIAVENDIYLKYWLATLVPIYDDGFFSDFWNANKGLAGELPNIFPNLPISRRKIMSDGARNRTKNGLEKIINRFGGKAESFFKHLQWAKIRKNKESKLFHWTKDVIVNDQMLKFHERDRREEFKKLFEEAALKYEI